MCVCVCVCTLSLSAACVSVLSASHLHHTRTHPHHAGRDDKKTRLVLSSPTRKATGHAYGTVVAELFASTSKEWLHLCRSGGIVANARNDCRWYACVSLRFILVFFFFLTSPPPPPSVLFVRVDRSPPPTSHTPPFVYRSRNHLLDHRVRCVAERPSSRRLPHSADLHR